MSFLWKKLLCFLDFHDWRVDKQSLKLARGKRDTRVCLRCGVKEVLSRNGCDWLRPKKI